MIVVSYLLGYFLGPIFAIPYSYLFSTSGTFISASSGLWIVGAPLAVVFLVVMFLYSYGGKKTATWTLVALLPIILFEVRFDYLHIYMPVLYGIAGWICGKIIHTLLFRANLVRV